MSNLIENARFAFETLNVNRFRTFLTLLGIIIGVAAVIMIGGASKSGRAMIFSELETFGLKSVWVYKSQEEDRPGRTFKQGSGIDNYDIMAILKECETIERITPIIEQKNLWVKYKHHFSKIKLLAVDSPYVDINNDAIVKGRFLLPGDIRYKRNVCVIGVKVIDKLFTREEAIGKEILVGNYKYTIVGILKKKERDFLSSIASTGGEDANDRIVIPISTFQRQQNTKEVAYIQAEVRQSFLARSVAEQIKNILYRRHKGQYNYASQTMQQYIETANTILRIVSWMGSIAAILSLIVGGIGIMNIMTASVVERTKEIGIRKALGAQKSDIVIQFLIEAVFICLLGGIIGALLGTSTIVIIEILGSKPILIAPEYIVLSLSISVVIGILSGLYPAVRAASLDPVDALRFE